MYIQDTVPCEPGCERSVIDGYKARYPVAEFGTVALVPVKTPSFTEAQVPYDLRFWRRRYPSIA